MKFRDWFQMMTLGHPGKYLRLMAWCLFDSIVVSIASLSLWQNPGPHSPLGYSGGLPPDSWPS